jgi:O-antigen/teichoic acid export membrane protein
MTATRVHRIRRNTVFNAVTAVVTAFTYFITGVVVARVLGPHTTGIYSLVNTTVVVATTLSATGFGFSVFKFVGQYDADDTREVVSGITRFAARGGAFVTLALAVALAVLAVPLANLFNQPEAVGFFLLAAVVLIPQALGRILSSILQGLQRQAVLLPIATAQGLVLFGGSVVVLATGGGITELLLVQLASGLCSLAIYAVALWGELRTARHRHLERPVRRRLISYAGSLTALSLVDLVVWQRSEVFFLAAFHPSSAVAFYAIAFAMADAVQRTLPAAFSGAVFPNLSRAFAVGDRSFMTRGYQDLIRFGFLFTLPIAVIGSILAVPIIETVYGDAYREAAVALAILLFSAGGQRVAYSFSSALTAGDKERLLLGITVVWSVLNLGLAVALIPPFGVVGASIANAATQLIAVAAGPPIISRVFGLSFPGRAVLRIVAAAAPTAIVVGAIALLVSNDVVAILVGGTVGVAVYAVAIVVTGALEPGERRLARASLARLVPLRLRAAHGG